jgi:hypothetical protein
MAVDELLERWCTALGCVATAEEGKVVERIGIGIDTLCPKTSLLLERTRNKW